MQQTLFQKFEFKGQEIDRRVVTEASYVEPLDLSGPLLVVGMINRQGYLTDELGIKEGEELQVNISDVGRGGVWEETLTFKIACITPAKTGDEIILDCVDATVWGLWQLDTDFIFSGDSVAKILATVLPGVKAEVDTYPMIEDYHSLNSRTSNLLRLMARELGSFCWYGRGQINFRKRETVLAQSPHFIAEYDSSNPVAGSIKILEHRPIRQQAMLKDLAKRRYIGFNIEKGFIEGAAEDGAPKVPSQTQSTRVLNALGTVAAPTVDLAIQGSGLARPGVTAKLIWHSHYFEGRPIDESLPAKVIVGKVAHYEDGERYYSKITAMELLE